MWVDSTLEPIHNASAGQVVLGEFHEHAVAAEHADVVLSHFAGQMRQDFVAIGQLDSERGVG